jgi:hypothetical protein
MTTNHQGNTMNTTKKRTTNTSPFRIDARAKAQLLWLKAALGHTIGDTKVSQSTIVRRSIDLYTKHMEHLLAEGGEVKPRLTQGEGHAIHACSRDQGTPWNGEFPPEPLQGDAGELVKYSALVTKYLAMKPRLNDVLAAQAEAMVAPSESPRFARRGG